MHEVSESDYLSDGEREGREEEKGLVAEARQTVEKKREGGRVPLHSPFSVHINVPKVA